jgi:hypothetical protein
MDKKQFEIDQLRKDKIIYAVEATATSVTALVAMFFVGSIGLISNPTLIIGLILGLAILYWVYVMVSNYLRLQKIHELESKL